MGHTCVVVAVGLAAAMLVWAALARAATTFTVTTTADGDDGSCTPAQCTLRDAIKYSSGGDTVVIPAASQPYSLTMGELAVAHSLTINGAGASKVTITANDQSRVFEFNSGGTLTGVTVEHGNGTALSGLGAPNDDGGAIAATGADLTISDSVVRDSTADDEGGGIYIENKTTLTNSTITGNTVQLGNGGGIAVEDELHLNGSTITGNHAVADVEFNTFTGLGGGIYNDDTAFIINSTITANTADTAGGGVWSEETHFTNVTLSGNTAPAPQAGFSGGANEFVNDTSSGGFQNSIVSNPQGGGDNCDSSGGLPASQGNNIEDDAGQSCQFTDPNDQSGVDPKLGPLADNGGPTQTMALQSGSPAIDRGATVPSVTTDQRGVSRPQGPAYDIGAFEVAVGADLSLTKSASPNPATVGQTLAYTVRATNNGPGAASGVTVTDTLPSSVTFKSASASQGSCGNSSGKVTCNLGGLAAGASATVTITVTPKSVGSVTNSATASSSTPDANSANNTASVTTQVQAGAVAGVAGTKPQAQTNNVTALTFTSATLHGKVNAGGAPTTYFFEFGTSKQYGSKTGSQSAGSATTFKSFARRVSGLHAGTLYHYRIVAENAHGKADGVDRTFRTPRRPSLHVNPNRVFAGQLVRVFGSAGGCPVGDQMTLLSHGFSPTHQFAGVPAIHTRVRSGGGYSTITRIPKGRRAQRYLVTARCGGGNLGVSARLTVLRRVVPKFTG
jgi:uncharacterized repeat protein (TIGR01451 family)/CSLREA domain-containing protein